MTDDKSSYVSPYDPEKLRVMRKEMIKMMEEFQRGAEEQEQRMVEWFKEQKQKDDKNDD